MAYPSYPAYQQAPYYPPPVATQPPADLFRRQYADRLRALTFNSRPIIQDLSMLALAARDRNDWEGMQIVVEEIEMAVLRAPPTQKLPLLYLLDSVSKNVGSPYTTHLLPPIIPRLYVRTYREVDGVTKAKMEEMIGLWRNGGPNGSELYGAGVRDQVERELFGAAGYHNSSAGPSRQQVQSLLNATLDGKRRELAMRPADGQVAIQMNALQGIGELLNTSNISPQELSAIMAQLKSMAAAPRPPVPTPLPVPSTPAWGVAPTASAPPASLPPFPPKLPSTGNSWPPPVRPPFAPTLPTPSTVVSTPPAPHLNTPIPPTGSTTPSLPPATVAAAPVVAPIAPIPNLPVDVAKILQTLNKSGLGSQPRTPEVPLSTTPVPPVKSSLEAYEDLILGMDTRLKSLNLNVPHRLSFDHLPHQCNQCGERFASDNAAAKAHMDWHFRRNRQERETGGRGAHRKWLPRVEEWIKNAVELPAVSDQATKTENSAISSERLAQLRQRWVPAPQDSKKASVCPVCKEAFKAEWSEDEEEWVWRNALIINKVHYHATCRAEQTSAMKRLKGDNNRRTSSSASPAATAADEQTPPKRKAEDAQYEGDTAKRVKLEEGSRGDGEHLGQATLPQETVKREETKEDAIEVNQSPDIVMACQQIDGGGTEGQEVHN
ncbi:hypothetical protein L202_03693 [Cryptococcus amylolentus CBS 6039]|uniref:CID domain-containing protein n=2 Tax=Cryptococcus amylolentus TaxID=104669 RepID=A0A1E3HUG9_9TREE|nr:hypothetical protein L202_03693 [Cryptococcus amylolentus CBS 6039]ODN79785.1 hypothetical protein L202_03693 [Cryptococcus amylolentus CBS 6039]ODO08069.1 hypothetical protein I350_03652 [Cryptococcus amylolentus CBS 6273]